GWLLGPGGLNLMSLSVDSEGIKLLAELTALGITQLDAIFCTNATEQHWDAMASLIRPFGHICTIAESSEPWDLSLLKSKSATFSQEFMFT
ncbi:hypothetical protein ACQ4LF_24105, partial [Aeromonas salmonicida]